MYVISSCMFILVALYTQNKDYSYLYYYKTEKIPILRILFNIMLK